MTESKNWLSHDYTIKDWQEINNYTNAFQEEQRLWAPTRAPRPTIFTFTFLFDSWLVDRSCSSGYIVLFHLCRQHQPYRHCVADRCHAAACLVVNSVYLCLKKSCTILRSPSALWTIDGFQGCWNYGGKWAFDPSLFKLLGDTPLLWVQDAHKNLCFT